MESNKAMEKIGAMTSFVFLLVIAFVTRGFVFRILWGWFITPAFGARELSLIEAIGLLFVVSYATKEGTYDYKKSDKNLGTLFAKAFGIAILAPAFVLFLAWVIKLFY